MTPVPRPTAAPEPTPDRSISTSLNGGVLSWRTTEPAAARYHISGDVMLWREGAAGPCEPPQMRESRRLRIDASIDEPARSYDLGLPPLPAQDTWYVGIEGVIRIDVIDASGTILFSGGFSRTRDLYCDITALPSATGTAG
jgi:hypothetical protein